MKSFLATAGLMTAILICAPAQAQAGTNPMSLGMSPPVLGGGAPPLPTIPAGPHSLKPVTRQVPMRSFAEVI